MSDYDRAQMDKGISLISALGGFSGLNFNPTTLVKTINCLYGLGFEGAVDVLVRYCRLSRESMRVYKPENALLVARLLFLPRDDKQVLPELFLGRADIDEPEAHDVFPLFPLHLFSDLPFLLVGGYLMGGEAQPPLEYIIWYEQNGIMRTNPLVPDDNPLKAVDVFLGSGSWRDLKPEQRHYWMLRTQALRAVSSVYPIAEEQIGDLISSEGNEEIWQRHKRIFTSLNVSWSRQRDDYVLEHA